VIGRLILASLVAVGVASVIRPIGQRHGWSPPVALGLSFLAAGLVALLVNAAVFG